MIALGPEVRKHFFLGAALLIVAERQSGFFLDCRVGRWAPWSTLAVECGAPSIALDIHLEDGRVMDQAVDGCQRHSLVREHLAPFTEWLIGGDQHRAPLVATSDQLEQHARFGLILADVDDVIEDQQMILIELGERTFEGELAARDLQALDEIAGAHEQHAPSVLNKRKPDSCTEVALAGPWGAEQQ